METRENSEILYSHVEDIFQGWKIEEGMDGVYVTLEYFGYNQLKAIKDLGHKVELYFWEEIKGRLNFILLIS